MLNVYCCGTVAEFGFFTLCIKLEALVVIILGVCNILVLIILGIVYVHLDSFIRIYIYVFIMAISILYLILSNCCKDMSTAF